MKFPGVDGASQTAGNNSRVTKEPIVLPDLPIMSDEIFIVFDDERKLFEANGKYDK
jgi:hypothetical protein